MHSDEVQQLIHFPYREVIHENPLVFVLEALLYTKLYTCCESVFVLFQAFGYKMMADAIATQNSHELYFLAFAGLANEG